MDDRSPHPETSEDTGVEPDRGAVSGTSRWQKVVGIIGVLVLLWVGNQMAGQLTGRGGGLGGGGGHGPPPGGRRHGP